MADDSRNTPREQLCRLGYADLEALSLRLNETPEHVMQPAVRGDILQAAGAVSDPSIRFGVEELAAQTSDHKTAVALLGLIGKESRHARTRVRRFFRLYLSRAHYRRCFRLLLA
jgi:hypothetical protein